MLLSNQKTINTIKSLPSYDDKLFGYVYIIDNGTFIKVGCTSNLYNRLTSLMNSNSGGHQLTQIAYSPCCAIFRTLEKIMHEKLAIYKTEGEWYDTITFAQACSLLSDLYNNQHFTWCDNTRIDFIHNRIHHNQDPHLEAISRWSSD